MQCLQRILLDNNGLNMVLMVIFRASAMMLFSQMYNSQTMPNYHPLMRLYQSRKSSIYKFFGRYFKFIRMPVGESQKEEAKRMVEEFPEFNDPNFNHTVFYGFVAHQLKDMFIE